MTFTLSPPPPFRFSCRRFILWPRRLNQKPNAQEVWSRMKRSGLPRALCTQNGLLQQRAFLCWILMSHQKDKVWQKKEKQKAPLVPLISFSLIRQDLCSSKRTCSEASTREGGQGKEQRLSKSSPQVNDGAAKCADMAPCLCHRGFVTFAPFMRTA